MTRSTPLTIDHDDEIDLLALAGTLLDYRWFIILTTLLFVGLGASYAILATPIYQANAMLQIEERSTGLPGLDIMDEFLLGKSHTLAELEILKSRSIVGQAVSELQLDTIIQTKRFPLIGDFIARRYQSEQETPLATPWFGLSSYDWGGANITLQQLKLPKQLAKQKLTLTAHNNQHYSLHLDDQLLLQGELGKEIESNGIKITISELVAHPGQQFFITQLPLLEATKQYQKNFQVNERGKQSGIISLSLRDKNEQLAEKFIDKIAELYVRQNIERSAAEASNSLEFLRHQLPNVKKDMEKAENKLNRYQINAKSADITIETQSILNQLVKVEAELSELRLKRLEMDKLFTSAHPSYQTLNKQIASLEDSKLQLEKRVSGLPEVQQELLRLNRDVGVSSQIYTMLLQKAQELDIARASTVGNVRIIDPAIADSTPIAPRKMLILLIALISGGLISITLAILHNMLNRGVESTEEIEATGLPVFASIPHSDKQIDSRGKNNKSFKQAIPLLAIEHPTDLSVEALRSLHTSLHFTIPSAKNNIIMISGPSPKVGKSFVSANLASLIALSGKKTLLIDADMRKGHLHYYFANENAVGLSDLLSEQSQLENSLQKQALDNLDFLPRGNIPPNPSELLLSSQFKQLLEQSAKLYDIILIDTPPILAVADALAVGQIAGSCFITVRFGLNPLAEIETAVKRFKDNGVTIKGAIFNAVEKRASHRYKYGYTNYQYSYTSEE